MRTLPLVLIALTALTAPGLSAVQVWEETITLPTYRLDEPDPNPMFYRGESYQGAQKRVYPYAFMDGITDEKGPAEYKGLFLENEYIQLCVLPEIGGRLFYAVDKTNGYDFFYRQHVIKPALIGMLGAWISGGVEWCVFHHHRNTTHMPVDYTLTENADGSKTIWIGETERRHRMHWIIGMTLHPGKSYIEVNVKMFNRTALPHSILYWANVAVHVNDDYQIVFPPSVQVATYHSKNDFVAWPMGTGQYRGVDYTGIDLSWWKNHPRQVSCFAWDLQEDFMGGYDHAADAGLVHVGNHHVVCGAKLWEWAPGNIWDTQVLTDEDGPYAELMVGAYSDNQPDYSWIKPGEVKDFTQYWYPIRQIGGFKNANLDAAVNLEVKDGVVELGMHATSPRRDARIVVTAGDTPLFEATADIAPDKPFLQKIELAQSLTPTELHAKLTDADGQVLIEYQPKALSSVDELPETVQPPAAPKDIPTVEELYLTGLRIEQIHNPSLDPMDYYREALRRDPGDTRTNTIVGIHCNRRGLYAKAEDHFRRAIERLSAEYTRPGNTEAYYHLGLSLKAQGRYEQAQDAFWRATWDSAFHSPAHLQLAILRCRAGDFAAALEQVNESLSTNARNTRARNLKTAILRRLKRYDGAGRLAQSVLRYDPLDFGAMNELYLVRKARGRTSAATTDLKTFATRMRGQAESYLELAADYADAGLWTEAVEVLEHTIQRNIAPARDDPMLHYWLGWLYERTGDRMKADRFRASATELPPEYCFPYRLESIDVLRWAIQAHPEDARAYYYLGNLLYELQPDEAIALWEKSRSLDGSFGTVHRNLGWAYNRHKGDTAAAITAYEKAIAADNTQPRFYLELDDLYERANTRPEQRLAALDRNRDIIYKRKPLLIRRIALLVQTGKYDEAVDLLTKNQFYVAEGGGRELGDAWVDAHVLRGLGRLADGDPASALTDFEAAAAYPANLSQEQARNDRRMPVVEYVTAQAHAMLGNRQKADEYRQGLADRNTREDSEARFCQILALRELGREDRATELADEMASSARRRLSGDGEVDFFAKFGEQQTRQSRRADDHYLLGLALTAKGQIDEARNQFEQALNFNTGHTWAKYVLSQISGQN